MESTVNHINSHRQREIIKNQRNQKQWYIAYTFPKAERKIYKKLELIGVTSYLPLHDVIRTWSDRKKKLTVPLFPNYIFIYTSASECYNLLSVKEIVKYVTFDGKPALISQSMIDSLKKMLTCDVEVSKEMLYTGMPVRVIEGPFLGTEGILLRQNGKSRLVILIDALQRSVSVDVSISSIIPVNNEAIYSSIKE